MKREIDMKKLQHPNPAIQAVLDEVVNNEYKRIKTLIDVEYLLKQKPDISEEELREYATTSYELEKPIMHNGIKYNTVDSLAMFIYNTNDIKDYHFLLKDLNRWIRHNLKTEKDIADFIYMKTRKFPDFGWGW